MKRERKKGLTKRIQRYTTTEQQGEESRKTEFVFPLDKDKNENKNKI